MKRVLIFIILLYSAATINMHAQQVAIKTNLLYDATTTLNLGIELGMGWHWTLDIPFNYNPWKWDDGMRVQHWGVQPAIRYWFCEKFNRTFVGLHAHYADFNVGGLRDWIPVSKNMKQNRYEGQLYGAGVSGGYSWILSNRWSLEMEIGIGYAHIVTDKYPCRTCGTSKGHSHKNYVGPTKASISLIYMIK